MLKMSQDFITNLLKSIRKSEATTIEKQRRIQDFLETIGELSASAQASENACRNLKQEVRGASSSCGFFNSFVKTEPGGHQSREGDH